MGDHYDKHREADYDSMRACDACMSKENVCQIGGGHICAKCQAEASRMQPKQEKREVYGLVKKTGGVEALDTLAEKPTQSQAQTFAEMGEYTNMDEYIAGTFESGGSRVAAEANRRLWDNSTDQDYKADAGKVRLSTVPASLERAVAAIRAVGISKYGDNERWRDVSVERYFDAMLRHVNAMREHGLQAVDDESGCKHLHHVACNVAFLVELLGHG